MPFAQSGSSSNMYYSFDYGLVHFVNVDTESTFPGAPEGKESGPFGDQAAWLKADLAKATANRANVPWILVGGHRPWFATDGGLQAQKDFFFPIFDEFDIDMIFAGYAHARTHSTRHHHLLSAVLPKLMLTLFFPVLCLPLSPALTQPHSLLRSAPPHTQASVHDLSVPHAVTHAMSLLLSVWCVQSACTR